MDERETEAFDHFVEIGAIELEGVDEDGEFLYSITDKAEEVAPELWRAHMDMTEKMMTEMFQKELINIEYDEELNAMISVSDKGIEYLRQSGFDV